MDQTKDIYSLNSKCPVDLDEVLSYGNEKKKVARRRWAILAKALKSPTASQPSSPTDEISVRRISSFMLLKTQQLPHIPIASNLESVDIPDALKKRTWYKYSACIDSREYFVNVGHRNRTFSAEDLMGFNNTGNVCIWPSEETLSYYVCSNLAQFRDKTVIELGGGMSCLAGLFAAKYGHPKEVTVTDGNKISVENVQATLRCNEFQVPVRSEVLKWSQGNPRAPPYNVVLCADCLFFDDARADLIECLRAYLTCDGVALVMAPQRGRTLDDFMAQSEMRGLRCEKITRADYWKSQERKYCDFCKCWIAANKPSIEFHEKGRRHVENVKKRIKQVSKKSALQERDKEKVDAAIKQMEAAAMSAYKKDVQSNSNADLTSIAITEKLKTDNLAINDKVWREAKTKEGSTYYYNTSTNESIWEPPAEGYLTLAEQQEMKDRETAQQLKELDKYNRTEAFKQMQIQKAEAEEERARLAREKLKERRIEDDIPAPVYGPILDPGKNDPYGKWHTIKPRESIDLQLPEQEYYQPPVVVQQQDPEPVQKVFKEKTVENLEGTGECSTFKKRKIGSGPKRNTRQRLNDD